MRLLTGARRESCLRETSFISTSYDSKNKQLLDNVHIVNIVEERFVWQHFIPIESE